MAKATKVQSCDDESDEEHDDENEYENKNDSDSDMTNLLKMNYLTC